MTGYETFTPTSSTESLQLHEGIASQAQSVTAQVKSIDFEHFHQAWPFLHVPTFSPEKQTALLTSAVANLSTWMQNTSRHHLVPCEINQELTRALMPKIVSVAYMVEPCSTKILKIGIDGRSLHRKAIGRYNLTNPTSIGRHLDLCDSRRCKIYSSVAKKRDKLTNRPRHLYLLWIGQHSGPILPSSLFDDSVSWMIDGTQNNTYNPRMSDGSRLRR